MLLSDTQIKQLLRQKSISDEWPWVTNNQAVIEANVKDIVSELCRKLRLEDRTDYEHYGSGYASYVDCWLYRPEDEFRYRPGNSYHGLVVLFSRLSPYYVLGQGDKSWDKTSGASYVPRFDFVDAIVHKPILELLPRVKSILAVRGLKYLQKSELGEFLPKGVRVPTVLADRAYRCFDALFYWED